MKTTKDLVTATAGKLCFTLTKCDFLALTGAQGFKMLCVCPCVSPSIQDIFIYAQKHSSKEPNRLGKLHREREKLKELLGKQAC